MRKKCYLSRVPIIINGVCVYGLHTSCTTLMTIRDAEHAINNRRDIDVPQYTPATSNLIVSVLISKGVGR